jgi:curved DNA-binding protein CbpA
MFGRLQVIIVGGIILFGLLSGLYYSWRKGIEREALLEYNQKQIEQNIADQKAMKEKLEAMDKIQTEIKAQNQAATKEFKDKMNNISSDIDSKKTVDRPASEVLKKTVNKLKDTPQ